MNKYWNYFKYVLEHKKNVFIECVNMSRLYKSKDKIDLIVHAFTHDMSKFLPCEFIPYAKYDFQNKKNNTSKIKEDFGKAWEHHYKHNKHHWNYWINKRIPYKYLLQMICDWKAMSRKFGNTVQAYYLNHYNEFNLTYNSRLELELTLGLNYSQAHNYGHILKEFAMDKELSKNWDANFGWIKDKYNVDLLKVLKVQ